MAARASRVTGCSRRCNANLGHRDDRTLPVVLAVQPVVLHRDVLTVDVAGFVEAATERSDTARIR
jgi:hypothetical protein